MKEKKLNFGIINIDKPTGPTSFSVSSFIQKRLGVKKTSHLGTLDPKVTGVLPVTLGRACRLAGYLISSDKEYVGILHTHKAYEKDFLQKMIDQNFMGKIKQTPPHKSAVKRAERTREVFSWNIIESDKSNKYFLFECSVEGGTYIRKLCSDLGEMIGGAHMHSLRRKRAGIFSEENLYSLNDLEDAVKEYEKGDKKKLLSMVIDAEEAIKKIMAVIEVKRSSLGHLMTGKFLQEDDITNKKDFDRIPFDSSFAIFSEDIFVEIARKVDDHRGAARPEFVYN